MVETMTNDGRLSLNLVTGDDTTIVITFTDDQNVPIDITGRTYAAMIRLKPSDTAPPAAAFTCTVTNAVAGELTLFLSRTDLTALDPAKCYWTDLQETYASLITTILLPGKVTITQDVTH